MSHGLLPVSKYESVLVYSRFITFLSLQSEMQLHEKEVMRQQHEEMLNEHRELIDALTAEILLVKEENVTMQVLNPPCSLPIRMTC